MVHAIVGVCALGREPAAGIPMVAWTTQQKADRKKVKLRFMSRDAGFLPDIAAALAFGAITTTLNRTALSQARHDEGNQAPGDDKGIM